MKILLPVHNGLFGFDGTFEEFEKLLNTPLTIDDIGEPIDDIGEALDNLAKAIGGMYDEDTKDNAKKDHPSPSELLATIVGKSL